MRRCIFLALMLALGACSKDKDPDSPAKLTDLQASLRVEHLWSADIGGEKVPLRLGLALASDGEHVFAAGRKGDVAAFSITTGHQLWHTRTKAALGGATALGNGLVVVGSSDGDVIALDAANGVARWRVRVNGEILSAPAIGARTVVVRTVDGKLHALAVSDGRELWQQQQQVPRLSLRGVGQPTLAGDVVICGFDNGKVVAVNSADGSIAWETPVAPSRGRTELERLVDIDSAVKVAEQDVYVVGFQGKVAMLALDTGQVWWSHEASSYRSLGFDADNLYMVGADGQVSALLRRTGTEVWQQKHLLHRGLSAPAVSDNTIVVGDFKGYVHWLDKASGALAARVSTGKFRISNAPIAVGNVVIVINDRGRIQAYRVTPLPGHAKAASKASQPQAAAPASTPAVQPAESAAPPPSPPRDADVAAPAPAAEPASAPAAPSKDLPPPPQGR